MGETRTDRFVDATAETEVELRLPLEVDVDRETQRRFGPPNGAKPKWPRHGIPTLPRAPEPHRQLPESGAQLVGFRDGRRKFGMSSPVYPSLAQRQQNAGIQQVKLTPDWFAFGLPTPALLSPDKQLPGLGTESEFDRFGDGFPKK